MGVVVGGVAALLTHVSTRAIIYIGQGGAAVKTSELLKELKRHNIQFVRHGSRHDIYYSPITDRQFPVPRHKSEIKDGTLRSILKDAGLK